MRLVTAQSPGATDRGTLRWRTRDVNQNMEILFVSSIFDLIVKIYMVTQNNLGNQLTRDLLSVCLGRRGSV